MDNDKNYKELDIEEIDNIMDTLHNNFPGRKTFMIHEKDSKLVHSDIVVMCPDTCESTSYILCTMGMSNTIMPDGSRCEVIIKVSSEMFLETPMSSELCHGKDVNQTTNPKYHQILKDMISISKMPEYDHGIYNNTDIIGFSDTIGFSDNRRIYGLNKLFDIIYENGQYDPIQVFYLVPGLTDDDLLKLSNIKYMSERINYMTKLMETNIYKF